MKYNYEFDMKYTDNPYIDIIVQCVKETGAEHLPAEIEQHLDPFPVEQPLRTPFDPIPLQDHSYKRIGQLLCNQRPHATVGVGHADPDDA